jgi:hypothetical protein
MISKTGYIESEQDPRDHILGYTPTELPASYTYEDMIPEVRDQGNTMKCVAYSTKYMIEVIRAMNKLGTDVKINDIYNSRTNEGEGMTIKEGMKYIHKHVPDTLGYGRLNSILAVKYHLLMTGPCVMALPVYSNNCDFWNGSEYAGGHAIVCVGYTEDSLVLVNSWGRDWGSAGKCYLPFKDFDKVLECWGIVA